MKDSIKRFLITAILLALSVSSAVYADSIILKKEKAEYPCNSEQGLLDTVRKYSESYGIPLEVIYTVMYMRSGCDPTFEENGRIGYMALTEKEIDELEGLLSLDITDEMLRVPSNNLMLGVEYISHLQSLYGDKNSIYASLICGKEEMLAFSENRKLYDVTGSLISLPEGHEKEEEFKKYLETEEKYVELYFEKTESKDRETVILD